MSSRAAGLKRKFPATYHILGYIIKIHSQKGRAWELQIRMLLLESQFACGCMDGNLWSGYLHANSTLV